MSSAEVPQFVSVADYLAAEEIALSKSEYVDGWVRAMTGASNRHNRVKINCLFQLMLALKGNRCQPFDSDTKVRILRQGSTRYYYPDLQVVCEANAATDVFQDSPVLIVEVLSPSTRRFDLDEKLNAYLQISALQCYVVLEQHWPTAIVMRRHESGFLRQVVEGVDARIELPFLNCSLWLRDIYEGIEFSTSCVQELGIEYRAP